MLRTAVRFLGPINPGNVADSFCRTGFYALRIAVAKETFAGDILFSVKAHHVPRTSFLAETAANADFFVYIAGAGLWIYANSTLRTSVSARYRVVALTASVLDTNRVKTESTVIGANEGRSLRTVPHVAVNLDSGKLRVGFSVIKFRTGQFTALTSHAKARIRNEDAFWC